MNKSAQATAIPDAQVPVEEPCPQQPESNTHIVGVVKRVEASRIVIQTGEQEASLQFKDAVPAVGDRLMAEQLFPEGTAVNV